MFRQPEEGCRKWQSAAAIFGQRVPYPAGVRIVISSQRMVSILFQNLLWPYMIFYYGST